MAVAGPMVYMGGAVRVALTTSSKAMGDFVLLLPGSCTCSLLIEAGREGQILQGYKS